MAKSLIMEKKSQGGSPIFENQKINIFIKSSQDIGQKDLWNVKKLETKHKTHQSVSGKDQMTLFAFGCNIVILHEFLTPDLLTDSCSIWSDWIPRMWKLWNSGTLDKTNFIGNLVYLPGLYIAFEKGDFLSLPTIKQQ